MLLWYYQYSNYFNDLSPNKRSFRGPGGASRGLNLQYGSKICAQELDSVVSRGLQGSPTTTTHNHHRPHENPNRPSGSKSLHFSLLWDYLSSVLICLCILLTVWITFDTASLSLHFWYNCPCFSLLLSPTSKPNAVPTSFCLFVSNCSARFQGCGVCQCRYVLKTIESMFIFSTCSIFWGRRVGRSP